MTTLIMLPNGDIAIQVDNAPENATLRGIEPYEDERGRSRIRLFGIEMADSHGEVCAFGGDVILLSSPCERHALQSVERSRASQIDILTVTAVCRQLICQLAFYQRPYQ